MKKLLPIDHCMGCPGWTFLDEKEFCKRINRTIPVNYPFEFPNWCPLKDEKRISFFDLFRKKK